MSKVMTDPLADVRERVDRAEEVEASGVEVSKGTRQYTADVKAVLSDVDALLVVVRAVNVIYSWNIAEHNGLLPSWKDYEQARAALPERLK